LKKKFFLIFFPTKKHKNLLIISHFGRFSFLLKFALAEMSTPPDVGHPPLKNCKTADWERLSRRKSEQETSDRVNPGINTRSEDFVTRSHSLNSRCHKLLKLLRFPKRLRFLCNSRFSGIPCFERTLKSIPPTKIRLGIIVPYFGAGLLSG